MYRVNVPYKDLNGKPRNEEVCLRMATRHAIRSVVELNAIFKWRDSLKGEDPRDLAPEEMRDFFNNFETVILAAYGKPADDGKRFDRSERYEFEDSILFDAFMDMILGDLPMTMKMLEGLLPQNGEEIVRKQAESMERMKAEIPDDTPPETRKALELQIENLTREIAKRDAEKFPGDD